MYCVNFVVFLLGNPKYKYTGMVEETMVCSCILYSRVVPDFEAVCISCFQQQHTIGNSDEGTVDLWMLLVSMK